MEKNTSGFYRKTSDRLSYAPNAVRAPDYDLFRADKDQYDYPVSGWHWFDSEEAARTFFNLPIEADNT
jgi:hypothetical protein